MNGRVRITGRQLLGITVMECFLRPLIPHIPRMLPQQRNQSASWEPMGSTASRSIVLALPSMLCPQQQRKDEHDGQQALFLPPFS